MTRGFAPHPTAPLNEDPGTPDGSPLDDVRATLYTGARAGVREYLVPRL